MLQNTRSFSRATGLFTLPASAALAHTAHNNHSSFGTRDTFCLTFCQQYTLLFDFVLHRRARLSNLFRANKDLVSQQLKRGGLMEMP